MTYWHFECTQYINTWFSAISIYITFSTTALEQTYPSANSHGSAGLWHDDTVPFARANSTLLITPIAFYKQKYISTIYAFSFFFEFIVWFGKKYHVQLNSYKTKTYCCADFCHTHFVFISIQTNSVNWKTGNAHTSSNKRTCGWLN